MLKGKLAQNLYHPFEFSAFLKKSGATHKNFFSWKYVSRGFLGRWTFDFGILFSIWGIRTKKWVIFTKIQQDKVFNCKNF